MIHGLDDYEKFKVIRPVLGEYLLDSNHLPIMHKITEDMIDIKNAVPLNIKNLSAKYNNADKLVLAFNFDNNILKYWKDPLKYIPVLQTTLAVGTPDYSAYECMNPIEIQHNVYMNRWLGCLWQYYGINAIPTIPWALPDTYDICFGGVEKGSMVIISTMGCSEHLDVFYDGFYRMKEVIDPSLIIVYGDMMPDMYGRFVHYSYREAFNSNRRTYKQMSLFDSTTIFEKKRGNSYGK